MTWQATNPEWDAFLEDVRVSRASIGSTYAGCWFRGQKADWPLLPSLYRATSKIAARIPDCEEQRRQLKKSLRNAERFARKSGLKEDERLRRDREALSLLDQKIRQLRERLPDPVTGSVHGEGRAFIEYRFRSGVAHDSSWQTLAEMQHYGIPTRLLDWTESFVFALAFALAEYIGKLEAIWSEERATVLARASDRGLSFHAPNHLFSNTPPTRPRLWLLNPYRLSESATTESLLWDLTLRREDDYYYRFVANRGGDGFRTFGKPIPMLTPWRDARIAAQQGVFTCFGRNTKPLEQQVGDDVACAVDISPNAALHGVRFLKEFCGIDAFTMFRDRDTLGKKAAKEFFYEHMQAGVVGYVAPRVDA